MFLIRGNLSVDRLLTESMNEPWRCSDNLLICATCNPVHPVLRFYPCLPRSPPCGKRPEPVICPPLTNRNLVWWSIVSRRPQACHLRIMFINRARRPLSQPCLGFCLSVIKPKTKTSWPLIRRSRISWRYLEPISLRNTSTSCFCSLLSKNQQY